MPDTSTTQTAVQRKSLAAPDETRSFERAKVEIVNVDGASIIRMNYEPGWRWSQHVKPIAKTDRCEVRHVGYMVQGRLKVVGRDGSEGEIKAGDGYVIPPGHDAWTVGDETAILLDVKGSSGPQR